MALETEIAYFNSHKDEFLKAYSGQFLLIKGEELLGAFTTAAQAYEAGVKRFGNQPCLIKRAVADEPTASFFALHFGPLRGG